MSYDDNLADDDFDDDFDEDADFESDDEDDTLPCPYCRREIHEDAVQCPYCEQYISAEDAPAEAKPWWIVVGVVLCLIIMLFWIVAGF